ncbi:hypothetical protein EYF80_001753 [Liparis tanakae]|uniref:Uncharacterized protein n=1 Tax=Liparis tanakae TaxID=230148 RepID=A0A4Z2JFX5_9TELE|nr:hypothetical protein EYF80_001753 [Liparis tanakae]
MRLSGERWRRLSGVRPAPSDLVRRVRGGASGEATPPEPVRGSEEVHLPPRLAALTAVHAQALREALPRGGAYGRLQAGEQPYRFYSRMPESGGLRSDKMKEDLRMTPERMPAGGQPRSQGTLLL